MISRNPPQSRAKTIVSVTPLRVQTDSRTFKQAASVARFGYISIAVEGQKSDLEAALLPFQLRTITRNDTAAAQSTGAARPPDIQASPRTARRVWQAYKNTLVSWYRRVPAPLHRPWRALSARLLKLRQAYREFMISEPAQFAKYVRDYLATYCFLALKHIPRASLYYVHGFYHFPAVFLLCLRYRARYIYDAHDFYPQIEDVASLSHFWANWIKPFERLIERWCIRHAAAVITVSDGVAQLYKDFFGCQVMVVRNVQDTRLDREPARHLRQELQLSAEQFLLVCVGNAKSGMAMAELFDALVALPPSVHVAFVGGRYDPYIEAARRKGLHQRVHFVPPVMPYEVVPFIRSADAALVIYYAESVNYNNCLPNGFFQPISAQLPLLYPELPELKKIAERYCIGIPIEPKSPPSIISGVTTLLDDPELRTRLRHNLQLAQPDLSWEHEENILRDLFAHILQS